MVKAVALAILSALCVVAQPVSADDSPHSLGIGVDVFSEAYAVAAGRVGAPAGLRLSTCTAGECRWHLGDDIVITTRLLPDGLSIDRLEAGAQNAVSPASAETYRAACLTIVALLDPRGEPDDRRAVAQTIALASPTLPQIDIRRPELGVTFYGMGTPTVARRCGVVSAGM